MTTEKKILGLRRFSDGVFALVCCQESDVQLGPDCSTFAEFERLVLKIRSDLDNAVTEARAQLKLHVVSQPSEPTSD